MIGEFYSNKTVFITGCTGFVGKVLLEKLLFDIPQIRKIYVLVRHKKGSSVQERFQKEIIDSPCFDRLRLREGNFDALVAGKIQPIEGDMTKEGLALSEADRVMLTSTVEVILNSAASVEFNQRLDQALQINTFGSLQILHLALASTNLKAFVQVSTAYVNCDKRGWIEEKIYPIARDPRLVFEELISMTVEEIEKKTPEILGKFPNTYTFTKNLTEQLFAIEGTGLPICIVRPTIIGASWKEPSIGWVDSVSAAGTLYLSAGLGFLKTSMGREDTVGDQIPVDYVSNCIICAAALTTSTEFMSVMHIGTSARNPITWGTSRNIVEGYWNRNPSEKQISRCRFRMFSNRKAFKLHKFVTRKVPGYMIQAYGMVTQSSKVKKFAQKYRKMLHRERLISNTFEHFTLFEWIFASQNVLRLMEQMDADERHRFELDVTKIDWRVFLLNFSSGLHRNILKENVDPPSELNNIDINYNYRRKYFSDIWWASTNGAQITTRGTKEMKSIILSSPKVQAAIREQASQESETSEVITKRAMEIMDKMFSNVKMSYVRFFGWVLRKIWRSIYDKVVVDHDMLKKLNHYRKENEGGLVLLPSHRSYIDFLIVSYVFFAHRIKVPYIAAGEDFLRISLMNHLLRLTGAFFIRRKIGTDKLYQTILTEYLQQLLQDQQILEFFIEGTRSRTGKTLPPKTGMLSMCTEAFFEGRIPDLHLVPITLNYERVLEGETFPLELLGEEKVKESLGRIFKAAKILKMNFGKIHVSIGTPISFKEYYAQNTAVSDINYKLANDIVIQIQDHIVIMPTALVSTILLSHRRNITEEELIAKVEWLRDEVISRGYRVGGIPNGTAQTSVKNAIMHLGTNVNCKKDIFEPSFSVKSEYNSILMLSYYRNTMQHVFTAEALAAVSMLSFGDKSAWIEGVPKSRLIEQNFFLNSWLEAEFVARKKLSEMDTVVGNIEMMVKKGLLIQKDDKILLNRKLEFGINIFCSFVYPVVDCYWATLMFSFALKMREHLTYEKLIQSVHWFAENLYEERVITFYESCSQESISNALKTFEKIGILQTLKEDRIVCLTSKYAEDESMIQELVDQFGTFRKTGFIKTLSDHEDLRRFLLSEFPVMPKL